MSYSDDANPIYTKMKQSLMPFYWFIDMCDSLGPNWTCLRLVYVCAWSNGAGQSLEAEKRYIFCTSPFTVTCQVYLADDQTATVGDRVAGTTRSWLRRAEAGGDGVLGSWGLGTAASFQYLLKFHFSQNKNCVLLKCGVWFQIEAYV